MRSAKGATLELDLCLFKGSFLCCFQEELRRHTNSAVSFWGTTKLPSGCGVASYFFCVV